MKQNELLQAQSNLVDTFPQALEYLRLEGAYYDTNTEAMAKYLKAKSAAATTGAPETTGFAAPSKRTSRTSTTDGEITTYGDKLDILKDKLISMGMEEVVQHGA